MSMKKSIVAAILCMPLLWGCGETDVKKAPQMPVASKQASNAGEFRNPDYHGLIEEYRNLLEQDPHNLAAIIALGNAYFDSSDWKNANSMYAQALLIDPKNADVRTDMGTAYRNRGMIGYALAEYRTALKYEPEHLNARYNMGVIYATNKKEYREAIRIWEELLNRAPNYPQAEKIRSMISTLQKAHKKESR